MTAVWFAHRSGQIRRLPHNKACVNCGAEATLGHGDVCVKFLTFVCHTCKSAHQSFSHRCKVGGGSMT
jgi:hypothetical protein